MKDLTVLAQFKEKNNKIMGYTLHPKSIVHRVRNEFFTFSAVETSKLELNDESTTDVENLESKKTSAFNTDNGGR